MVSVATKMMQHMNYILVDKNTKLTKQSGVLFWNIFSKMTMLPDVASTYPWHCARLNIFPLHMTFVCFLISESLRVIAVHCAQ